jgi:multidrug efflux pump subunit AcrB
VPLSAVATLRYDLEQPMAIRRGRVPTITLKAGILTAAQPDTVVRDLEPIVEKFRDRLPVGYSVVTGGTVEESGNAQDLSRRSCR